MRSSTQSAINSQTSPWRAFVDLPVKTKTVSWWVGADQYFYALAKREARRMRLKETSTATFSEPIGSRTRRREEEDED